MEAASKRALKYLCAVLIPMLLSANGPLATIEDTGSTNRAGMRVTFDHEGNATVEQRNGETRHVKLRENLCNEFMRDLKAASPLSALPARHCMKSVSFGSRLFIEFNGDRSPDLSCPGQQDSRAQALQKDAQQMLQAAQEASGLRSVRPIS